MTTFFVCFMSVFIALDVLGNLPLYLSITKDMENEERVRIVNTALLVAFGVAVVFMLIGKQIFFHFGILLSDFRIAGGLILLLLGLHEIAGSGHSVARPARSSGIVPLAVPLISGPAVITTILLQVDQTGIFIMSSCLILNYAFAWLVLRKSDLLTRYLGQNGSMIAAKLAALLLVAMAVSMIRMGLFESFSELIKSNATGHKI